MSISGINGGNNILMSMAKLRVEAGMITQAAIVGTKGEYRVIFDNREAQWKGEPLCLSSARDPYNSKVFKSIDGAVADIERIGLNRQSIRFEKLI